MSRTVTWKADGTLYKLSWAVSGEGDAAKAGWSSELVASDVISFADDKTYVTGDHVLHYSKYMSGDNQLHNEYCDEVLPGFKAVKGKTTYFAISDNNELYGWGNNSLGQVGNGGKWDTYTFVPVFVGGTFDTLPAMSGVGVSVIEPCLIMRNVDDIRNVMMPTYRDIYVCDSNGVFWTWGNAPEDSRARLQIFKDQETGRITADTLNIIPPDAAYNSPKNCGTEPVTWSGIYELEIHSDGSIYTKINKFTDVGMGVETVKLPVTWSEVMQ